MMLSTMFISLLAIQILFLCRKSCTCRSWHGLDFPRPQGSAWASGVSCRPVQVWGNRRGGGKGAWELSAIKHQQWSCVLYHSITQVCAAAAAAAAAKSLQSCPTLCDPIDGSALGSPVPGVLQEKTLKWVAISFSNACMHAKSLQ